MNLILNDESLKNRLSLSTNRLEETLLMIASKNGFDQIVYLLLHKGKVNPNIRHKYNGKTALHLSSEKGNFKYLRSTCN